MIIEAGRLCKHKEGRNPSIEAGPRGSAEESAAIRNASRTRFRAKNTRGNYGILAKIAHFRGFFLDLPAAKMYSNVYRFGRRCSCLRSR